MEKINKILAIIIIVLCMIGIMITLGIAYTYATIDTNNIAENKVENVTSIDNNDKIIQNKTIKNNNGNNNYDDNKTTKDDIIFTEKRETVYAKCDVNIRKGPNVESEKTGVLVKGNSITRIATGSNGWDKVEYNNITAYICHDYLSTEKVIVEQPKKENPDNYLIKNVPFIAQNPQYPNGCEAASTTMLLNYYGIKISLSDFINNYLDMDKVYTEDGVRYGPNPEICYAGDPSSAHGGWGCFPTAIENAVNKLVDEKYNNQYTVHKNTSNSSLSELA